MNRKVAIVGCGMVASKIRGILASEGYRLLVTDTLAEASERITDEGLIVIVEPEDKLTDTDHAVAAMQMMLDHVPLVVVVQKGSINFEPGDNFALGNIDLIISEFDAEKMEATLEYLSQPKNVAK